MKQTCQCCGTCCRNGGPPLHGEDHSLVTSGVLSFKDLITVRRGELVVPPMASKPIVAKSEWIKIQGQGSQWCCKFLNNISNECTIYKNRPISCRVLKCWDTDAILAMAGHDLLSRMDLIDDNDPLLPFVQLQEEQIPLPDFVEIQDALNESEAHPGLLQSLSIMVQDDLHIREKVHHTFKLSVATELFYFGRPLFQLLFPLGIETCETHHSITLRFRSPEKFP